MRLLTHAALILASAALIAAGAYIDLPMHPVPMSMQTFAIALVAALTRPLVSTLSVVLYIAAGAMGAPVFAGGEAGAAHLIGPTAGYFAGFLIAAYAMSALAQKSRGFVALCAIMLLGHAIILASGTARLALLMPGEEALAAGLTPFLLSAAVKSLAAALVAHVVRTRTAWRAHT